MSETHRDQRGLLEALIGDGRPVLTFSGLYLILCGGFALFQSATGYLLPHDAEYLGMNAKQLCALNQCRVVHFMFHDRVAFGGVLIAVRLLYVWLAEFPLRNGEAWAWWAFAVSGTLGFASFLTYLGYGYLDTWHGIATLLLLPCFVVGLVRSKSIMPNLTPVRCLVKPAVGISFRSLASLGRALLLATAVGLIVAGLTISILGATRVFVPQDVKYLGLNPGDLQAINARLVPLIAHDRAGFGGALLTCGALWLFCVWCGRPSRSLWQVLCASGSIGFLTAIGIHLIVGYVDFVHLAPALLGALIFTFGIVLSLGPMCSDAKPGHRVQESRT